MRERGVPVKEPQDSQNEFCRLVPQMLPGTDFEGWAVSNKSVKYLFKFGSPGRIRTSDQPVNSRLLYR
jgi:hypothetical protein